MYLCCEKKNSPVGKHKKFDGLFAFISTNFNNKTKLNIFGGKTEL